MRNVKKLMMAVLIAVATTTVAQLQPDEKESQTNDVREAVLRYQIASWKLAADSYCVKIDGKDADTNLLSRLRPLRVKPASQCRRQNLTNLPEIDYSIVDRNTKKRSVVFDIRDVRFPTPSSANVDGGYDCASLCNAYGTYHLKWDGKKWAVSEFEIEIQVLTALLAINPDTTHYLRSRCRVVSGEYHSQP